MSKTAPTIVTAYFDIGRGEFKGDYTRGNNKYINYFKFWARIKNELVVYTQPEFEDEILEIREKFGLKDKTKIIVIDDIYSLYPEIYKRMNEIEKNECFKKYRYIKYSPDNMAKYDYIMFLKTWCLMDAVKNNYVSTEFIAWFDFGFNHGGDIYSCEDDFDFLWEYDFEDKIYLSSIKKDDGKPIFQIIQNSEVYIQGCPYMIPTHLMNTFYDLIYQSLWSLLDNGFIDDDQTLLLMAYRKNTSIFKTNIYDWFMIFYNCGANHMKLTTKKETKQSLKDKILYKYRVNKRNRKYLKGLKSIFLKDYLD